MISIEQIWKKRKLFFEEFSSLRTICDNIQQLRIYTPIFKIHIRNITFHHFCYKEWEQMKRQSMIVFSYVTSNSIF